MSALLLITPPQAAALGLTLTMIAVILDNVETLALAGQYRASGVFNAQFRLKPPTLFPGPVAKLRRLLSYPRLLALPVLSLVCALSLLLDRHTHPAARVLCILACGTLLKLLQGRSGAEGAHTILTMLLTGLFCFFAYPAGWLGEAALIFIGVQTIVAYTASGFAKLVNPDWHSGQAVIRIMAMDLFQHPRIARLFRGFPLISKAACWSVLILECGCIAFVFVSPWTCAAFLVAGVGFHAFIAWTQGLNLFLWVFLATYPVLWLLSQQVHLLLVKH